MKFPWWLVAGFQLDTRLFSMVKKVHYAWAPAYLSSFATCLLSLHFLPLPACFLICSSWACSFATLSAFLHLHLAHIPCVQHVFPFYHTITTSAWIDVHSCDSSIFWSQPSSYTRLTSIWANYLVNAYHIPGIVLYFNRLSHLIIMGTLRWSTI